MNPPTHNEHQSTEWKSVWHDDWLKWVCGFANAQGGTLWLGKNNKGKVVVGLQNAKKLMEDLPNKIRATMGIVVDVNLQSENGLDVIAVVVPAYPNAISYHGKYYYRSGSTNQELSGYALDEMLLRKYGRSYDSMPLPRITMGDFWHDAFDVFRKKAVASKRLTAEDAAVTDEELLGSLKLIENDRLLLAAALVFHQAPEQWCLGAYVKIGYFATDAEILYQDELYGALVGMADKVVDTIFTKYFIGHIRYEGLQRIDDYPMPHAALREAVMNALVHRDYSTGSPIQIRVYDNRVVIANDCRLPEGTTLSDLAAAHKSVAINPLVAGAIFRSGQIEAWGRGIERIIALCVTDNLPEPEFIITPRTFTICFHTRDNQRTDASAGVASNETSSTAESDFGLNLGLNFGLNEPQITVLKLLAANPTTTLQAVAETFGMTRRNVEAHVRALKGTGILKRIGSKKSGQWEVVSSIEPEKNTEMDFGLNFGLNEHQIVVLKLLAANPATTLQAAAETLGMTSRNVEAHARALKEAGVLKRIGSKKTGHWEVVSKSHSPKKAKTPKK